MDMTRRLQNRTELLRAARIITEHVARHERRFTVREKIAMSTLIDLATDQIPVLEALDVPAAARWGDVPATA